MQGKRPVRTRRWVLVLEGGQDGHVQMPTDCVLHGALVYITRSWCLIGAIGGTLLGKQRDIYKQGPWKWGADSSWCLLARIGWSGIGAG